MKFGTCIVAEWFHGQPWYLKVAPDHLGLIPMWIDPNNPSPAAQQLDANYGHGGGWNPFEGFTLTESNSLVYPGDPPLHPIAYTALRNETVVMYKHAWVAIIQPDRSFEVCRMD